MTRHGRSAPHARVGFACLALLVTACSDSPAHVRGNGAPSIVVTQLPLAVGEARPSHDLPIEARYPPGSRVILVRPGAPTRVLSEGLAAAGAPAVSPDGDRVLFSGRSRSDGTWAIYETAVHGGRVKELVRLDRDCTDPVYLAGDRIAFSCQDAPMAAGSTSRPTWSLYAASRRGKEVERITYGAGSAFDPSRLPDGRLLFSMGGGASTRLFTVNPDGALFAALTDDHRAELSEHRARATDDGGVIFLALDRDGSAAGLRRIELSRPTAELLKLGLALKAGSIEIPVEPFTAEPSFEGRILVAGRAEPLAGAPSTAAVFLLDREELNLVFDDPDRDDVEAVPIIRGRVLRGRPSSLDPTRKTGILVCYDTGRSDGVVGPSSDAPAAATLEVEALRQPSAIAGRLAQTLGRAPVAADGSAFLEVPADTPIRVRSLDREGEEIATSAWFWIRPGEVRACFGCHESRESAPVNREIAALAGEPAIVTGAAGGTPR